MTVPAAIRERYLEYRRGVRPSPVNADGRLSRRAQAAALFDALEQVVRGRRVTPAPQSAPGHATASTPK